MSTLTNDELITQLAGVMTKGGFPTTAEEISANLDEPYERWELDSLGHLELMVALGERYGVRISDADAQALKTPAATVDYLTGVLRGDD